MTYPLASFLENVQVVLQMWLSFREKTPTFDNVEVSAMIKAVLWESILFRQKLIEVKDQKVVKLDVWLTIKSLNGNGLGSER